MDWGLIWFTLGAALVCCGTILRKLPRKVDVLEGENAAFCVEVEKEEMDIHWYKDGIELRETHQTIIKSFGRTHILVFVNTMPQDSGLVTFLVGRSKTSSQLRVKAARHCPPSCPVGVQINTEHANAALLSWVPAPDSRKNPPSGYVLERQEVGTGSQEWLQCLTTDSATSVEILGDSVPCEADYRFRICSVNKYGKSNNVEFPRTVHLVPVARIQAPLQDGLVPEGQDALFTIELSASVIGTWFLNGTQLQEDERYSLRRSRTHQSLRIRGVRDTDNGAEITFIAYGIRDSAALYIQAPLVKFSPLSEMDRNKFVEVGNPIVLYCELSDPAAPVHWYKNGVELQTVEGLHIQSEGTMRRIVIQSADFSHSGVYCCDAIDDVIRFNVEVEASPALPVRITTLHEADRSKAVEVGEPFELRCEISDSNAEVTWFKDGIKLSEAAGQNMVTEGAIRTLAFQSAMLSHAGIYRCKTSDDSMQFYVDVKAPPLTFAALSEADQNMTVVAGSPIALQCELSDPSGEVSWYKDGRKLLVQSGVDIQSQGSLRSLVVPPAERAHKGLPVKFSKLQEKDRNRSIEEGNPLVLNCELSHDPSTHVDWYKDGIQLGSWDNVEMKSDGLTRTLLIPSAESIHAGIYKCSTSDDSITFKVDIKGQSPRIMATPLSEKYKIIRIGSPIILQCEVSDPAAQVSWFKNEVELFSKTGLDMKRNGTLRKLIIHSAKVSDSGLYSCSLTDEAVTFQVDIEVPPLTFADIPEKDLFCSAVEQELLVLSCEVSRTDGVVQWYKDGTEIQPSNNIRMEAEGAKRNLIIQSAQLSDTGTYTCRTGDNILIFKVNIREPPVMIVYPKEDVHLERHVPEEVILSCELSRPNGVVGWFKDGQKLQESENIKLKSEGPYRRLKILSSRVEDSGEYVCDTADDSIFFHLNITGKFLDSVQLAAEMVVLNFILKSYAMVRHVA
ncbi:hypothetical protein ILYODFUR_013837 [Ilyodon furcidens]|uniref:Obscurin like cytoskeletal adaptor 1b n=1 Tax=Ilyodon furcidens TaxID=33524 RepID=A0ABV0V2U5_9TELE